MSALFSPMKIGNVEIPNRFVNSATYECMAKETGEVSDDLIKRYVRLAKGGVGLIITGVMFVHPFGRGYKYQTGIHHDSMIQGLKRLVDAVHQAGGKIAFQLVHSGRQTTKDMIGQTPLAPSSRGRDPINFVKPKEMTEDEIVEVIKAFGAAAKRAVEAGADAIQLHGAHGYLINEFLSPFFNIRTDSWGGSDDNRFRFLKEIYQEVKEVVPDSLPVLLKLNTNDYTPKEGVTPSLAATYSGWIAELGIDAVEVSCGTTNYSYMNMCRGDVPTAELVKGLSWWEKPIGRLMIGKLEGKYDLEEGYNIEAAKIIKPVIGDIPLLLVGGMRTVSHMEEVLGNNYADFISMSRPFIREPFLVNKIKENKMDKVSCVSCNRCLAAVANELPLYCYNKGFPTG
ncbi:MAG: NADH:flavin oxidoreductase [Deltaproteobacteria bacterium]|nr:NADH:flavin oxidoreductase [Deltaproteobacteria bacterium]MBW1848209.1 NADH:flavin oxidoreductase [Deltaproteobacteria bacterium]